MNDEWSRCPICFEDYSLLHRPTTFTCGHSTCIDHTVGASALQNCPICRFKLPAQQQYHVSYNLEEASRLFHLIKKTVDLSKVQLPSNPPDAKIDHSSCSAMIHRDEILARQLHDHLNNAHRRKAATKTPVSLENPQHIVASASASARIESVSRMKGCGHRCGLTATRRCCACSDRRPASANHGYATYVDGRGIQFGAERSEGYCPTCKP